MIKLTGLKKKLKQVWKINFNMELNEEFWELLEFRNNSGLFIVIGKKNINVY